MKLIKQLKKGVVVEVIAGKDKGKSGKVLSVSRETGRVLIENINMYKKHRKPTKQGEKGQVVSVPRTIDMSNVKVK
ncbi:MAG: 50S ribosomal protein L24 [Candidatus Harrisonbacteria bacterium CG10_big_fil_rev_8_21_14_0_10_45_28]|uniref:Large ribosomal subunit protein uL24 n=1 Tax=Candidatus Harrisonbacteria bacterium CG10_big_fil_rev_8_21_14_0_10_45_28 TaxID=1974586 RepID=A0A2H0UNX8_9BACT|nr:MAG: 50S ribosomal protein L24 [Candidatus Harrisonbacteria bacterium CG10_big_fil_rev_8_21_14_0_10_45_28]